MPQLSAQGPIGVPGPTSAAMSHTSPPPLALGQTARDVDGNEYVLCSAGATVSAKQPVTISATFDVAPLATTGRGPVGIAQATATSDQLVWVLIYGYGLIQLGMSGVSPSDAANGPTTLSTSVTTRFVLGSSLTSPNGIGWVSDNACTAVNFYVDDIFVATDADPTAITAVTTTSAHIGHEIKVFLAYPKIRYINYGA